MSFTSNQAALVVLLITAFACSRTLLLSFDDPEGPNLLIVSVFAAVLYGVSFVLYRFSAATRPIRFVIALLAQIVVAFSLHFVLV